MIALNEYNQLYGWGSNDKMQLGFVSEDKDKGVRKPIQLQQLAETETVQVNKATFRGIWGLIIFDRQYLVILEHFVSVTNSQLKILIKVY